jgi:hypothetical protein
MQLLHRGEFGTFLNEAGLVGSGVEVGAADGTFARDLLRTWRGQRLVLLD